MSAWYYEPQYAKNFLRFKVDHAEVLKLFGIKQKDYEKSAQEDPQLYKMMNILE